MRLMSTAVIKRRGLISEKCTQPTGNRVCIAAPVAHFCSITSPSSATRLKVTAVRASSCVVEPKHNEHTTPTSTSTTSTTADL
jgi:hypothetical protein